MSHNERREKDVTVADRGIISDILNSFVGAAFGAFMGILIANTGNIWHAAILFIVTIVSLCGAVSFYLDSVLHGTVYCITIWGFGIALSFFFPDFIPAVIMLVLTSTFWMWSFYPEVFNKWAGAN